jgi:hypothetical protein
MAAAGFTEGLALEIANEVAAYHFQSNPNQYRNRQMDNSRPALPAANVVNISAGFEAQRNGTTCHK